MPDTPWPTERGSEAGIVLQFGRTRADLVRAALTEGDPLADAVVTDIHETGRAVRRSLQTGLEQGLAAVPDAPASVRALLSHTEGLVDGADPDLLDRGSRAFFTAPTPVHIVSLSAGALIRVYESPSIARVLSTTGRLVEGADRRIQETGRWVITAMMPGALRPGAPGYVSTVQVRLLHAEMRRLARQRSYDEAALGVPINQVDLARTWMDFTVTSFAAETAMGFGLTTREAAELYRYWWLLGQLLGIRPELIEGIASNEQARRVDDLWQAVTGPLIEESAVLADATLGSISDVLHEALNVPPSLGRVGLDVLARTFHGPALADELRLREHRVAHRAVTTAIDRVRSHRAGLRADPDRWRASIEQNIAESRERLREDQSPTLFQSA